MTTRSCHAGLWMTLILVFAAAKTQAEQLPLPETSRRNTARTKIVQRAELSTVNIHTEKRQRSIDVVFSSGKATKINGMGTGIVIDERGYIVTNYHVVQDVERLRVSTFEGVEYDGRVVAFDSREDLAIIKVEPVSSMTVARFGTSSDLMLGEDVIAIGNAYGYESSVTRGIISHRSRDVEVNDEQSYDNLIQIDAAINPGNSGGPLINADGEIIGINVAIRAGAQRIGFAIPIDAARLVIARLMNIERHSQTYHGLVLEDYKDGQDRKLIVRSLNSDSPALAAGIQPGDVIVKAGETDIVDAADLERSLFGKAAGTNIPLVIRRDGEQQEVTMTLAQLGAERRVPGQQGLPNTSPPTSLANDSVEERCWQILGLKLAPLNSDLPGQPYRGGMRVEAVRQHSPADINGISTGDILVGLHIWETVNEENINYVLNHPQLQSIGPLKFYIVRDGETLFGHFQLAIARR